MPLIRRSHRSLLAVLAGALAALPAAPAASAEEPPAASAEAAPIAQTLFEEGRRLMEAKQYAEACPKFEESLRLRPGTGTRMNLALCNEALGKTATAWAQFKEVLFAAKKEGNEGREAFAKEHIDAIEPRLARLRINAEATPGLVIRRDGQEIPAAAIGTPIPVDPGTHTIEATAPGYSVWSTYIEIKGAAEAKTVAIPKLTPQPAHEGAGAGGPRPDTAPAAGGWGTRRIAGIAIGGAGVAALGVGVVLGIVAAGEAGSAEDDAALCPGKVCSPAGREAIDAASTKALVSTVGVGVGVAAIGVGAFLILTAGGSPAVTKEAGRLPATARLVPVIGPSGGGVSVVGAF